MKDRLFIAIPTLVALLCTGSLIYLLIQLDATRQRFQDDGVLEFNFVQQMDHNFDVFSESLEDYRTAKTDDKLRVAKEKYIQRFDILWSALHHIDRGWLGTLNDQATTEQLVQDATAFLNENESLMSPDVALTEDDLIRITKESRVMSSRIYELGLTMFQNKSRVRDDISNRMNTQYLAFCISALMLVLAGGLAFYSLSRAHKRMETLAADRHATEFKLTTALEELTSGDQERKAQNRFIAAASHDLRQPLHALGLYLSALKAHISTQRGHGILENISRSTEALNELLSSLLDISKLDAGVIDATEESFSLDSVFEQLHQTFQPEALENGLALDVNLTDLWVKSDRVLLERILRNLVSNGLKYTSKGSVSLDAEKHGEKVRILVADTGLGIPKNEQEAIFNEYYQLHNPERDRAKGLGLGLSIVRRLAKLLELEVNIVSEHAQGTTFQILVQEGEPRRSASKIHHLGRSYDDELANLSILVIDDEADVRESMRSVLDEKVRIVLTADSASDACEQLISSEIVPDLIIADYRLRDDQTGDSAIERVREEVNEDVPAMIITGDTSPARLREATASGFRLLHKPVVTEDLLLAVADLSANERELL